MLETAGLDSAVLDAGIAAQQLQLVNAIVDEDRQYATRLTITRTDNENVSESVISTVISWLMKKKVLSKEHCDSFREGTYSTPDGWNGTTELEQGKTALASKRNSGVPGCVVWAMELDEQDHRLIYGRWHTRLGIIGNADSCIVNIQLSRYIVRGFIGEAAPPIPSTPRIVKMLFSDEANVVRVGSTFLNDKPIYLTSETLTSKFIPDLTDPNRTLSLILITTDEESKLPVRNLKNLTKQLFGMADIYVLDWHDRALMDTYREAFLKNTPAYDYGIECSSLKIYCKPVDLTVPADNEMGMAYAKYLIDRYTRHGENRFINVLRQGICRASDRVAGDILSIADVRWLDGIDEAKRLSSRIKKLKQRVKGDSGGNETVDSLRDEISGLQKDMEEKRLCARPVIELTTMREYADVHDALKFGSRYVDWKKIVAICDAKGEPTSEATRWRGERWFWKDDWNKNIKLKSGERIKDMQPVICYERGRCDYSVLDLTNYHGFYHKSLLNSGKKGIVFDGLTWRLLRYDVDFKKRLKETPLICRETGKTFDTLSDLQDWLEREHECCMYDLQRAIEGGWEYKGFHFEYMVPPSVSGER